MKYAIIGKSGRVVKAYKTRAKAMKVMAGLKDTGATLKMLAPAKTKGVRNAGVLKSYRATTIMDVSKVVTKGQERPAYGIYVEGVLLTYASTYEDAVFFCRKARGFMRRLLQRRFKMRIVEMSRSERQVVAA